MTMHAPRVLLGLSFVAGGLLGGGLAAWALGSRQQQSDMPVPALLAAPASAAVGAGGPQAQSPAAAERCPAFPPSAAAPAAVAAPQASSAVAPTPPSGGVAQVPLLLSAEHAHMLKPLLDTERQPTVQDLHALLLTEGKDPAWAPGLEAHLRQALSAGKGGAEFDVPTIECRETVCEVLAFGNLPGSTERWGQMWRDIAQQPWWTDIRFHVTSSMAINNRHVLVTVFRRAPAAGARR